MRYLSPRGLVVALFQFFSRVACAASNNSSTVAEAFPQLVNLQKYSASLYSLSVGAQDMDHCCLLAVNDSLQVINGMLVGLRPDQSFIVDDFQTFQNRQFPCYANYIGDKNGAPTVRIKYSYCKNNCPGWQRSGNSKLNQWVSPFVGFLVPAVVFCLAIPRRRKIWIPDRLFDVELNKLTSTPIKTPLIALLAALLISIDTILWLMAIFALSGPILLSGIYEAFLDNKILNYVQNTLEFSRLSTAKRAHLLYIILAGNLDLNTGSAWDHIDCDPHDPESESLLKELKVMTHPASYAEKTKTHLRTMLACQYSFGVTVGAPVVFFCASFIYTLIDNYSNLGDNNTSHALAFGMWWMTIPHIAIISGLLLAGNNPNTLEGVVGRESAPRPARQWLIFELVYDSRYQPAWIWNRGRSKRIWALRLTHDLDSSDTLKKKITIGFSDWISIFMLAYALVVLPSTLAFLTSFYTPAVGLSCRSMTFLIYMLCQFCLMLLWIWNIQTTTLDDDFQPHVPVRRNPLIANDHSRKHSSTAWYPWVWYPLVVIDVLCATFTAIGGTMLQIIGVYRNCLCNIPITVWHRPYDDDVSFVISSNSAEDIHWAQTIWTGTGVTAVVFLGFVSFVGWWYQMRLRYEFKKIIMMIDERSEQEMHLIPGVDVEGRVKRSMDANKGDAHCASEEGDDNARKDQKGGDSFAIHWEGEDTARISREVEHEAEEHEEGKPNGVGGRCHHCGNSC